MFIEYESNLDFNSTIEAITASAEKNKWSVPHIYDLQATMKKHNYEVESVKVFSLCKPEHAFQILSGNDERVASALMPCRVSVYQKNGKTHVSMINAGFLSKFMGKKIKDIMDAASEENKLILSPVIKN